MTQTEQDPNADRLDQELRLFLRLPAVIKMTGLSRSTVYRLVADKRFPRPMRLGPRVVAWRASDLDRWSQERPST